MQKAKRKISSALVLTAVPFLLIIIIEIVLRFLNIGIDFNPISQYSQGVTTENPNYYKLFHPRSGQILDQPAIGNFFPYKKEPGTVRGILIGESTAQGFPFFQNQSFGKVAEVLLKSQGKKVEILNFGKSAMSSYYLRETLPLLSSLEPDFIIIYAGHNEYYGTPSLTTNPNHFANLLNLSLKKLYFFQSIFNLITPEVSNKTTMMEQRFDLVSGAKQRPSDDKIISIFLENLQAGLAPYLAKGIPIIVMDPISNLVDMPPFRSVGQEKKELWTMGYQAAIGNIDSAWESFEILAKEEKFADTALFHYLLGIWKKHKSEAYLDQFLFAKDSDSVPFRAKENLRNSLKNSIEILSLKNNIHWFDTYEKLTSALGEPALGNIAFIDHLHFNWPAQKGLGIKLAEVISDKVFRATRVYSTSEINSFDIESNVSLSPFFHWSAIKLVMDLLQDEPYRGMQIKPDFNLSKTKDLLEQQIGLDLIQKILPRDPQEWISILARELDNRKDFASADKLFTGFVWVSPGSWNSNLLMGLRGLDKKAEKSIIFDYLARAFVLSHKSSVAKDMISKKLLDLGLKSDSDQFFKSFNR